jgi:hypothetical protein
MKKNRNYMGAMPYPGGMMPGAVMPGTVIPTPGMSPMVGGMPMNNMIPAGATPVMNTMMTSANVTGEQLNHIQGQINMLDKRVNHLESNFMKDENMSKFGDSNFHVM